MNVKFKTIKIENFLSIGKAEVSLCEQGFVLVKGVNNESGVIQSNGSGKSSIFDAIFWTINGETLRGATEVLNEKASKDEGCLCELTLEVDTNEYRVVRTKKHPELGTTCCLYEDDTLLSDQLKKTQEMISKLIPVTSSDILGSIALLGQGLPYRFSALSPSKRKDLLEVMSGSSSQIDKLKYQLDIESSSYEEVRHKEEMTINTCNANIMALENSKSVLTAQQESLKSPEKINEEIKSNQDMIQDLQNKIAEVDVKLGPLEGQIESLKTAEVSLRDYISKTVASISQLKSQISQINTGNCPTCGRPFDNQAESMSKKNSLESQIAESENLVTQLNAKLSGLVSQTSKYEETRRNLTGVKTSCQFTINECHRKIVELNNSLGAASGLSDKIKEIEESIKSSKIQRHDTEDKTIETQQYLDCIGYLKRQLSRDFKGYMLEEVIKFLSSRSEYYSDFLFSTGSKIEVTLSGNKILISVGGRLYENLSGGERQRVDLAVQFALRDMLVTTSGFSCNLLVLDEAFDNLDAQGSESLVKLVTSEFSDIDSVFIVTHHSEIDIPYDQSLTVTKGPNGISSVEVE